MNLHTMTLSYYAAKQGKVKGEIKLDSTSKFEMPTYKKDKYDNFFVLSCEGHKMEIRTLDAVGLQAWKKTCEYCIATMSS
jgi:hypothetical protein